ncbi:MAG: LytR/AlgR family response regulator transcription factor [Thermonemataceae bacterium]
MKVVIIEDEELAQQELAALLGELSIPIEIVAYLKSVASSVEWLTTNSQAFDLIFMDIELLDGQSFEIFQHIEQDIPIIFLTAYDEYAIQAFKYNSIDYLLKPVEQEELNSAIQKYNNLQKKLSHSVLKALQALVQKKNYKERFTIRIGDHYHYVHTSDLAYFSSTYKTTCITTVSAKVFPIDFSLNELETYLDPSLFFRVSRKYLVHIQSIEKASKFFHSRLKLKLTPKSTEEVLISRVKVPQFLEWMGSQ